MEKKMTDEEKDRQCEQVIMNAAKLAEMASNQQGVEETTTGARKAISSLVLAAIGIAAAIELDMDEFATMARRLSKTVRIARVDIPKDGKIVPFNPNIKI
jgi:hypothetical protein